MKAFKADIQKQVGWLVAAIIVCLAIVIAGFLFGERVYGNDHMKGFITGVQTGLFLTLAIIAGRRLFRSLRALRGDDALEKMYIEQTDERTRHICNQVGRIGLSMILVIIAVATVVAGFFDDTVFLTLLCALAVIAFTKAGVTLYVSSRS